MKLCPRALTKTGDKKTYTINISDWFHNMDHVGISETTPL